MMEWVHKRLVRWGEFRSGRRYGGAAGANYPAYRLVHIRGTGAMTDLVDPDVMETDRVMAQVKLDRPKWYEVACCVYVDGLSHQTTAGRVRVHRDTVYARIDALHNMVANRLSERVAK